MADHLQAAPTTIPFGPRRIADPLLFTAALGQPTQALAAWEQWRSEVPQSEAPNILMWAGGYVAQNVRAAGGDDSYLEGIRRHNLLRNAKTIARIRPVVLALSQRRPIVPIKGGALSITGAARVQRPFADLDVFVAPELMAEVGRELVQAGLHPIENLEVDELEFRVMPRRSSWSFRDAEGRDLDVHWRILEHLSLEKSRDFVEHHAERTATALGQVGMLRTEAQAMVLLMHHMAEDPEAPHSLYDLITLVRSSDASHLWEVAEEAELGSWLDATLLRAEQILGEEIVARPAVEPISMPWPLSYRMSPFEIDAKRAATGHHVRRRWNPEVSERTERDRWKRRVASVAVRRSGSSSVERLARRFGGPLSEGSTPWGSRLSFAGVPALGRALGPGWNVQYPEQDFRWTDGPDARVLLAWPGGDSAFLGIEVDATAWMRSRHRTVRVLANGEVLGCFPEDRESVTFAVTRPRDGVVEVSLQPVTSARWRDLGHGTHPYRYSLPVRSIELRPI